MHANLICLIISPLEIMFEEQQLKLITLFDLTNFLG